MAGQAIGNIFNPQAMAEAARLNFQQKMQPVQNQMQIMQQLNNPAMQQKFMKAKSLDYNSIISNTAKEHGIDEQLAMKFLTSLNHNILKGIE